MDGYTKEFVAPDDPHRCQAIAGTTQCRLKAVDGTNLCSAHGGGLLRQTAERKAMKNYRLTKFKARAEELGNSDGLFSLKDEVSILRMLIEERVEKCQDNYELVASSQPLSDLIMKCEKLVTSCQRLESKLGNLLDKTKVLQFAQLIIEIIGKYIDDEELLDKIGDEILKALNVVSVG